MRTLLFCTTWADSADLWRLRYGKWLAHVLHSPLHYAQVLLVDDGSPLRPPIEDLAVLDAERLPADCPAAKIVFARFANRLGRPGALDYPGWWRSFFLAAQYAANYGFDKIIHVESDAFVLSAALSGYLNAIDSGWTALWCPYHGVPETCIQVIGRDQLRACLGIAREPYAPRFVGRVAETLLPFTQIESCFKGDRYGEYRTDLPLDADWASQVPIGTAVWSGSAPDAKKVLAVSIGGTPIPPHPALYQHDAWSRVASVADPDAAVLATRLAEVAPGSLDAIQASVSSGSGEAPGLPLGGLRRLLRADGELLVQLRPSLGKERLDTVARSALQAGLVVCGGAVVPRRGDFLIIARDDDPRTPSLRNERLLRRLQLATQAQGSRLPGG